MLIWTVWEIVLERFLRFGETIQENLIFWETRWLSWPIYWTFKISKKCLSYILTCLPGILTCPSDIFPGKTPRCLSMILTCFPDILTWHANILPEKNAKLSLRYFHVSLGHLNIPLRHLAGKKTRCLPQILKCLSGILPVKKCLPDIWTCLSNIFPEKCQDVSPTS